MDVSARIVSYDLVFNTVKFSAALTISYGSSKGDVNVSGVRELGWKVLLDDESLERISSLLERLGLSYTQAREDDIGIEITGAIQYAMQSN